MTRHRALPNAVCRTQRPTLRTHALLTLLIVGASAGVPLPAAPAAAGALAGAQESAVEPYADAHEKWGFPGSPTGQRLAAVLEMLNSKDEEEARRFLESALAPRFLEEPGLDEMVRRTVEIWSGLGDLEVQGVMKTGPNAGRLVLATGDGPGVAVSLEHEPDPPHRITRIEVGPHAAESPVPEFTSIGEADAYLREKTEADEFAGVVLVAVDDQAVFERAYGLADRDRGVANTVDTAFNVGSITKDFTRTAILQLEQAGKLKLSDRLGRHLPHFPEEMKEVTVEQLLEMKGGFGDYLGTPEFQENPDAYGDLDRLLELIAGMPLEFEPGTRERYSNSGYAVLGGIVAAASGEDYRDYVTKNVFAKAGMEGSRFLERRDTEGAAIGYTRQGGELRSNLGRLPTRGSPAGSSYSTARDLLKFQIALREGRLEAGTDAYRPGCWAGGGPGVSAVVCSGLAAGQHVVVLSNADPMLAERVGARLARQLANGDLDLDLDGAAR